MLLTITAVPLTHLARESQVGAAAGIVLSGIIATVSVVVARRQPRNPIGWILLGSGVLQVLMTDGQLYALLDYRLGYRGLPLGTAAIILGLAWAPLIVVYALLIPLFPDGQLSRAWRRVLWMYLGLGALWVAGWGTIAASVLIRPHATIDASGGLGAVDHPTGLANLLNWGLIVLAVFWLAFVGRQVVSYRRAAGERRQQLKGVMYGATITATTLLSTNFYAAPSGSALGHAIGVVVNVGLVALPISMGVAILKYRLIEIDRLISRTLSHAVVSVSPGHGLHRARPVHYAYPAACLASRCRCLHSTNSGWPGLGWSASGLPAWVVDQRRQRRHLRHPDPPSLGGVRSGEFAPHRSRAAAAGPDGLQRL